MDSSKNFSNFRGKLVCRVCFAGAIWRVCKGKTREASEEYLRNASRQIGFDYWALKFDDDARRPTLADKDRIFNRAIEIAKESLAGGRGG